MTRRIALSFFFFLLTAPFAASLSAVEISFKNGPVAVGGPFVRLVDVAIIEGNTDDQSATVLRQTVLFPTPLPGEEKEMTVLELRNTLSQVGFGSTNFTISGANAVTVIGKDADDSFVIKPTQRKGSGNGSIINASYTVAKTVEDDNRMGFNETHPNTSSLKPSKSPVSVPFIKTLEQELGKAIAVYLDNAVHANREIPWNVTLKLSQEQAHSLGTGGQIVAIDGGTSPYTGAQQFRITLQNQSAVTVDANVMVLPQAVVVRYALPKGHIISESDITVEPVERLKNDNYYVAPKEVIGLETTAPVKDRTVLTPNMVKKPLLVRKGDIVTVRSTAPGVLVKINAMSLQDGSKGDVIHVQSIHPDMENRRHKPGHSSPDLETYRAKVTDIKTVQVLGEAGVSL